MLQASQQNLVSSITPDLSLLDNPIWSALNTVHAELAVGDTLVRRYPADVGPLSGIAEVSARAYEALHQLASPRDVLVLFLEAPFQPEPGWKLIRNGRLDQMICTRTAQLEREPLAGGATLRELATADIPQMVALAELTEPGPFRARTSRLGRFWGVFDGDRLLAMAGQRMCVPGLREVSAVCTHPDARGRGYAHAVMIKVINDIVRRGELPFLHVLPENDSAIRVYKALGFIYRRSFELAVLHSE